MLRAQSRELEKRMLELEQQAHAQAGQAFNLGSPKQIQEVLYGKLGLPVLRRTPTGQPSTAEEVLEELALDYPLPKIILEHRTLAKLKSTYTDKLPEMINPKTGRVHTSYHQAVAATGRLSSSDPNLQNIPIRTDEGRRIRQAFVPERGYRILAADYSQIELRIMAHLSGDAGLIRAFAEGQDVHRATAAEVFGVAPGLVSDDMRRAAKTINFGLIYGMSAFGLARSLKIERTAAAEYIERYFARYPGVRAFMERTRESARSLGYVETLFGRRLYLSEINAPNQTRRQAAERAAINAPMQGTAADFIKRAMIVADRWIVESGADVPHDHAGARRVGVRGTHGGARGNDGANPPLHGGGCNPLGAVGGGHRRGRQLGGCALGEPHPAILGPRPSSRSHRRNTCTKPVRIFCESIQREPGRNALVYT